MMVTGIMGWLDEEESQWMKVAGAEYRIKTATDRDYSTNNKYVLSELNY